MEKVEFNLLSRQDIENFTMKEALEGNTDLAEMMCANWTFFHEKRYMLSDVLRDGNYNKLTLQPSFKILTIKENRFFEVSQKATSLLIRPKIMITDTLKLFLAQQEEKGKEVLLGNYPQWATSFDLNDQLEELYQMNRLQKGDHKYTFFENFEEYQKMEYPVYLWKDKEYIRFITQNNEMVPLRNGRIYLKKEPVWVEVAPVSFIVDQKQGMLVSKYGLITGVPFSLNDVDTYTYEHSLIKWYFTRFMEKELLSEKTNTNKMDSFAKDVDFVSERVHLLRLSYAIPKEETDPIMRRLEKIKNKTY